MAHVASGGAGTGHSASSTDAFNSVVMTVIGEGFERSAGKSFRETWKAVMASLPKDGRVKAAFDEAAKSSKPIADAGLFRVVFDGAGALFASEFERIPGVKKLSPEARLVIKVLGSHGLSGLGHGISDAASYDRVVGEIADKTRSPDSTPADQRTGAYDRFGIYGNQLHLLVIESDGKVARDGNGVAISACPYVFERQSAWNADPMNAERFEGGGKDKSGNARPPRKVPGRKFNCPDFPTEYAVRLTDGHGDCPYCVGTSAAKAKLSPATSHSKDWMAELAKSAPEVHGVLVATTFIEPGWLAGIENDDILGDLVREGMATATLVQLVRELKHRGEVSVEDTLDDAGKVEGKSYQLTTGGFEILKRTIDNLGPGSKDLKTQAVGIVGWVTKGLKSPRASTAFWTSVIAILAFAGVWMWLFWVEGMEELLKGLFWTTDHAEGYPKVWRGAIFVILTTSWMVHPFRVVASWLATLSRNIATAVCLAAAIGLGVHGVNAWSQVSAIELLLPPVFFVGYGAGCLAKQVGFEANLNLALGRTAMRMLSVATVLTVCGLAIAFFVTETGKQFLAWTGLTLALLTAIGLPLVGIAVALLLFAGFCKLVAQSEAKIVAGIVTVVVVGALLWFGWDFYHSAPKALAASVDTVEDMVEAVAPVTNPAPAPTAKPAAPKTVNKAQKDLCDRLAPAKRKEKCGY